MNEAQVLAKLKVRYSGEAWAFITHVPDATGAAKRRTADAVAMGCWPSRGLLLHGHEVKVSRGDWLTELRNPAKADAIARYCDRWWLVAGEPGIVLPGELPDTWGLLVVKGGRVVCEREAPELAPEALDRKFLAALLRSATGRAPVPVEVEAARAEGYDHGARSAGDRLKQAERELTGLRANVQEFERLTGTYLRTWGDAGKAGRETGNLIRALLQGDKRADQLEDRLRRVAADAQAIADAASSYQPNGQSKLPLGRAA